MNDKVKHAIIIPSYNEGLALPELLSRIVGDLQTSDAILIMDDSAQETARDIDSKCASLFVDYDCNYFFFNHGIKSGRGAAIRRGMKISRDLFPNLEFVMECDADGSHQPKDILRVKNSDSNMDLVIGSRYLPNSSIVGWPLTRRIFSFALNKTIPKLFDINISDITNGLRRYSVTAVDAILSQTQRNNGFIYLSEQAIIVNSAKLRINEFPIDFIDRTLGESTVSWREVTSSITGIIGLLAKFLHINHTPSPK